MNDLLKVFPIYGILLISNLWVSFCNVTFWLSKMKSGIYTLPFIDKVFETWWGFTLAAWFFNSITCYIWVTLLVAKAYKISVDSFGVLMSAFVISQLMSVVTHLFFLYLQARESPTRNELIALILIVVASFLIVRPAK